MAINAVTVYCGVEEGRSYRDRSSGCSVSGGTSMIVNAEQQVRSKSNIMLGQAIKSVVTDKLTRICFLCVGNPALPMDDRVKEYATVGSLSRHFRRHIKKLQTDQQIDCRLCNLRLVHKLHVLNHAESAHGSVTRVCA